MSSKPSFSQAARFVSQVLMSTFRPSKNGLDARSWIFPHLTTRLSVLPLHIQASRMFMEQASLKNIDVGKTGDARHTSSAHFWSKADNQRAKLIEPDLAVHVLYTG